MAIGPKGDAHHFFPAGLLILLSTFFFHPNHACWVNQAGGKMYRATEGVVGALARPAGGVGV